MNAFLLDVWHDLQQKKLWPVAAILVLALLLVPVFLLESSADEGNAPPMLTEGASPSAGAPASPVALESAQPSSRLDVFGSKDPFTRPSHRTQADRARQALAQLSQGVEEVAEGAFSVGLAAGSETTASDPFGSLSSGSSSPLGDSGGGSSSSGSPSPSTPSTTPEAGGSTSSDPKDLDVFTYRVDLRFGAEEVRDYEDVKRLTPLPGEDRPYLVFLGVSEDGKEAIFMVDRAKFPESDGEGECSPSPEECTLLSLTKDEESDTHSFTDADGKRYALRITDIHLDEVKQSSTATGAKAKASRARAARAKRVQAARAERAEAEDGKSSRDRDFAFPDFFDLFRGRR